MQMLHKRSIQVFLKVKVLFKLMIQKKSLINVIKRALEVGTFNYVGQEAKQFPAQLLKISDVEIEGQKWWDCVPISKMDFSNNEIKNIPKQIVMFADLQLLRIKNNQLAELPPCLAQLQNLKSLDVSKNRIEIFPKQMASCLALVQLNVSQNYITNLPPLCSIKTLEHLLLNQNKIKALPLLGEGLKKVQACNNMISSISTEVFCRCYNLQILILNKNCIQHIDKDAFEHTRNMIQLELKENRLINFTEMPWSKKLDNISLSFNRLTQFNDFDRCPNLTVLVLNDNKIKKIFPGILKLQKLKTLDISNNDLADLPSEIGFIESLVRLQIQGNALRAIRQNIRASGTNQLKKYLRDRMHPSQRQSIEKQLVPESNTSSNEQWRKLLQQFTTNGQLVLRAMKLQSLDQSVFQKNLTLLNISQNKIAHISESISKLKSLKSIILNHNQLTKFPYSLASLLNLQYIEAQNNQIQTFVDLQRPYFAVLKYLDLSTNRLRQFPEPILHISKLRTLLMSYNKIPSIECVFAEKVLPLLEILDVSNNQIQSISEAVYNMQSLNYLNLENNNMSKLPTVLGFMKLLSLKVDGNPLKLIKRSVIDKGTVSLLDFLRTKHAGDPPTKKFKEDSNKNQQQQIRDIKQSFTKQEQKSSRIQIDMQQKRNNIQQQNIILDIQKQIKYIEYQLQNNMALNNIQKNQKKKRRQNLMIQRNKILQK